MTLEDFYFDDWVRMFCSSQEFINTHRGALAVSHTVDNQPRSEYAVAAGKNAGGRRHQRLRIDCDQSARRNVNTILRTQELKIGRLANSHNDGVAIKTCFAVLKEGGTEAAVSVKYRLSLENLEGYSAPVLADDSLRAKSRVHDDAFFFSLFNLFEGCGHLRAILETHKMYFLRAQPQCGERDVNHFPSRHGIQASLGRLEVFDTAGMLTEHLASSGAGNIHGHVAATDHEDFFADSELVAQIHIEQKIDAFIDTV